MLTICCWLWGWKYSKADVDRLRIGLERHLKQPHRFVCISDHPIDSYPYVQIPKQDLPLLQAPGCFARLRLFDPKFQDEIGATDKIVNIDLDVVVTGELDYLFETNATFKILSGANAANPCPYNGSIFMLRKGAHQDVIDKFSTDVAKEIPFMEFPDDQAWFHHMMPNAETWPVAGSGIYAFEKPGWPRRSVELPKNAVLVVFPGWRHPSLFRDIPWIYENWTVLSSFRTI